MMSKSDKRKNRVQPIRLARDFFPLDIHKSMFINDLTITIPSYYVKSWGSIIDNHNKDNFKWQIDLIYKRPKKYNEEILKFKATLWLSFIENRNKESSYRLKWGKDFATQLAEDYPKSFVRSLEFHIGDEEYKQKEYTEFDIGGFKEQLQVQINWKNNNPIINIKEFFRVKEGSQEFPIVYKELCNYLISDYLLSDVEEIQKRIIVNDWKPRNELEKQINENNIYLLLNRERNELYIGETGKSLSSRYHRNQKHHSFEDWNEFLVIQLPQKTSNHNRLLIERILIQFSSILFPNKVSQTKTPILNQKEGLKLMNLKK